MRLPQSWSTARVTLALTLATAALWAVLTMLRLGDWAVAWGGFVPARIGAEGGGSGAPVWLTPLTAAFLHSTPLHLAVNLLFLVLCGRPTEAVLGPVGLLILYLLGAYAAAAGHYLAGPADPLPALGASGAVSAVVGAYSILFGRNKVKVASPRLAL